MEVEHFSHPDHPLILINKVLEYSCELVICSGCEGPIWGPCYSCTSCYFFLHKKCAELPREIKRAFIVDTLSIYWQSHHIKENVIVIGAAKLATVIEEDERATSFSLLNHEN
jgi:hypothetical protein